MYPAFPEERCSPTCQHGGEDEDFTVHSNSGRRKRVPGPHCVAVHRSALFSQRLFVFDPTYIWGLKFYVLRRWTSFAGEHT